LDFNISRRLASIALLMAFGLLFAACQTTDIPNTPLPSPAATFTADPTATRTPPTPTSPPPLAVLLAPSNAEPSLASRAQPLVAELASQEGFRFQVRPDLPAGEGETVQIVVVLPGVEGVAELAAANPGTRFLAVGIPGLAPAENLGVIGGQPLSPDIAGFVAGYMAAAITEDWRVGVISESGTPSGEAAQTGFTNGVYYLCGLCRPVYPPFPAGGYPLYVELSPQSTADEWQAAVTYFQTWQVETVYVEAGVAVPGLLAELARAGFSIISTNQAPERLQAQWVASIRQDDPLQALPDAWQRLLAGSGGEAVELPVIITDVNPDLLSPGRQRLVEKMMVDLLSGYIGTGAPTPSAE